MRIRKRTQQNGIDDTKDRGGAANTDCERDDDNRGETGLFEQTFQSVTQIDQIDYSYLSEIVGSTFVALRPGI